MTIGPTVDDLASVAVSFTDLLDALGYAEGEYVALCHQRPGRDFAAAVAAYSASLADDFLATGADVAACKWFGVNPVTTRAAGRGTVEDVTRLAAIWCDLDVKPGACRDLNHAHEIVAELSAILGTRPTVVVSSGGGLQPYWRIDTPTFAGETQRADAAALVKRWGRMACAVADKLGARIDRGVYDLSRVLRIPGSDNHKYSPARPVTARADTGGPITLDELRERLDELGVGELAGDRATPAEVIADPAGWVDATTPCAFWPNVLRAWPNEPIGERHTWLTKNAVRIEAGRRMGCFDAHGYTEARRVATEAFLAACARDRRHVPAMEVPNAFAWAADRVARMHDDELPAQIGSSARPHTHDTVDLFAYQAEKAAARAAPARVRRTGGERAATLASARATFRKWLGEDYDLDALDVTLAVLAVESLDGDPLWLLVVSGSGNAKTETVCAANQVDGVHIASTIASEGALLSATSKRERSAEASGGLLREIGHRGTLVLKDVTSVLSMGREMRAQVLAALREVYDGAWMRNVGTDGGRKIEWQGRIAFLGAVTTAWDTHHAVVSQMGDRFVLLRISSKQGRLRAGRQAIANTGSEAVMRAELAAAVRDVIAGADRDAVALTDDETERLLAAADLVTLSRTAVEFDFQGNPTQAHEPEMPTRFAKQLAQVLRGAVAVGMPRNEALRLALRCARDSMPPIRLQIIDYLATHQAGAYTTDVRKGVKLPRTTVDRQLQALHMLGVLDCAEEEYGSDGSRFRWRYSLADGINPTVLVIPDRTQTCPDLLVAGHSEGVM